MAVHWRERAVDAAARDALVAVGYSPLQARLLVLRGVTAGTADAFFEPSLTDLAAPEELPGVAEAADVLLAAVREGRKIVVFGDYDCDGVCATAILVQAVRALGGTVAPFLPERLTEGYGMNEASVERMLSEHPDVSLVVTVDNGVNAVERVAFLKSRGVDVVVTDHHLPGEELPDCVLVDPKVAAPDALDGLCGAGVAFLLAAALVAAAKAAGVYDGPNIGGPLLVLAGLATVTDIMPLTGQNRILVAEALKRFRSWAPVGLRELLDRASRTTASVLTTRDFGFLIGPRINAAGRIASGMEALSLVLAADREEARSLALAVDLRNATRKTIEQKMTDEALSQVEPGAAAQIVVLTGDGAHPGIAGIVASRILERLGPGAAVPVCVIVNGHGSARSPEGYNVRDALQGAADALERFGGHAAAGGFTVREGGLDGFRGLFRAACAAQAASGAAPDKGVEFADAEIDGAALTLEFARWLRKLEPFGEGNPPPVFLMRRVLFSEVRPMGAEGRHLQAAFRDARAPRGVWWNHGDLVERLRAEAAEPHDILFTVEVSNYGEPHPEIRLQAVVRSE